MKVTGFTIVKDAIKYDYPVIEAISSVLPLCDEFVVAVGKSSDGTLDLIKSIKSTKIIIINTEWDLSNRKGGNVLAVETNKAFAAISADSDWAFYIQGDEVVHEKFHDTIYHEMKFNLDHKNVDGLLFKYLHFYGSYDYIGSSAKWYKNEIRIIRNDKSFFSFRDAQGFRKANNNLLQVKPIDAYIYHYGWVKKPEVMQQKQLEFNKYWHDDEWIEKNVLKGVEFDYSKIDELKQFTGIHPKVMQNRIKEKNWKFDYDLSLNKLSAKEKVKLLLNKYLGLDFSYKNYRIVK